MYTVDHCLACNTLNVTKEPAYLAQFVVWKATDEFVYEHQPTHGVVCNQCSFVGSRHRLSDEEERRLYSGYRNEEYNNKRIFCEPWYKEHVEKFNTQQYVEERKVGINTLIDRNVDIVTISTVLDYGGDNGVHIPKKFIKAKLFVSDISGAALAPGVLPYPSDPSAKRLKVDFLMCCHVLEHKSDLDILVKDLKNHIHDKSWIYIEVPNFDNPMPGGLFHEHLNRFNLKSMTALLNKHGIDVVDSLVSPTSSGDCLCVLGKLKL